MQIIVPKEFHRIYDVLQDMDKDWGVNGWMTRTYMLAAKFHENVLNHLMFLSSAEASNVATLSKRHRALEIAGLTAIQIIIDMEGHWNLELKSSNTDIKKLDLLAPAIKTMEFGAEKYGANAWLRGEHFDRKSNHASMFRHLAEDYTGKVRDDESGLHPLYHLLTRALMEYTLDLRGKL